MEESQSNLQRHQLLLFNVEKLREKIKRLQITFKKKKAVRNKK